MWMSSTFRAPASPSIPAALPRHRRHPRLRPAGTERRRSWVACRLETRRADRLDLPAVAEGVANLLLAHAPGALAGRLAVAEAEQVEASPGPDDVRKLAHVDRPFL